MPNVLAGIKEGRLRWHLKVYREKGQCFSDALVVSSRTLDHCRQTLDLHMWTDWHMDSLIHHKQLIKMSVTIHLPTTFNWTHVSFARPQRVEVWPSRYMLLASMYYLVLVRCYNCNVACAEVTPRVCPAVTQLTQPVHYFIDLHVTTARPHNYTRAAFNITSHHSIN